MTSFLELLPGYKKSTLTISVMPHGLVHESEEKLRAHFLHTGTPSATGLSLRPSVTSRYCVETTGQIELVLARMLRCTYPTLCCKGIWVSPKIRVHFSELCPKLRTLNKQNFATVSRSHCQQNSSSSSSTTVELVDDTYTTVDESWLF